MTLNKIQKESVLVVFAKSMVGFCIVLLIFKLKNPPNSTNITVLTRGTP